MKKQKFSLALKKCLNKIFGRTFNAAANLPVHMDFLTESSTPIKSNFNESKYFSNCPSGILNKGSRVCLTFLSEDTKSLKRLFRSNEA